MHIVECVNVYVTVLLKYFGFLLIWLWVFPIVKLYRDQYWQSDSIWAASSEEPNLT